MIVDANVLLYAVNRDSDRHATARTWLDGALDGPETVGFAWVVLLAFIRLSTNRTIFPKPLSIDEALGQVQSWLDAPLAAAVSPTARHVGILHGLLLESGSGGNLTTDAHLAALALEHGAEIVSYDRDFGRFTGLRHRLPS